MTEQIGTRSKKVRGMARQSLDLIEAMYAAAEAAQPITGRGIGYKLFTAGLIPSMATNEMQRVYRLLKEAREQGDIPWEWIVDETRALERTSTWATQPNMPAASRDPIAATSGTSSPSASKCGARRAPCAACSRPVLDQYAVGFRVMHGFSSATTVHDVAEDDDGRPLIVLYVGDFDPSGMFMSEEDLPDAARQVRRRSRHAEAHRADARAGARPAVVPGGRQEAKTRATSGSSPTMGIAAGNWMRWTPTIFATASRGRSRN